MMMHRAMRGVCIIGAFMALAWAQQPAIRVTTHLVEVNVIVRDKNGPVAGLTKDDFVLLDKGKEQRIAVFNVSSARRAMPNAPPLPPDVYSNRFERQAHAPASATVVLIDNLNTKFEDQAYARHQILKFLRSLELEDRIALYSLGRGVRILHDFTDDQQRLIRSIANYRGETAHELAASEPDSSHTGDADIDKWLDEMNGGMSDFYIIDRVRTTLTAMEAIANHLARLPGRKNLIWVSGSFPFSLGLNDPLGSPAREHRTFNDEIERATRAMNNANIAIYPVDARGLVGMPRLSAGNKPVAKPRAASNPRGAPRAITDIPAGHDAMQALAERTGGRAFYNTNDLRGAIRKALEDSEVTYTLAFYPASQTLDGKFHELKVKVDRKGVEVRHRKGYLAAGQRLPTDRQMRATIDNTVSSPLEATGVGLTARLDPSDKPKPGSYQMMLAVDMRNLTVQQNDDRWMGAAEVVFVQQSAEGKSLNSSIETLNLDMKDETYRAAVRDGLVLVKGIVPEKELSQVRVAVLDRATGMIGSLRVPAPQSPSAVR
ncbi:MAG: hypothetical protein DMG59_06725 [Acidobacteria bacterium]|nr:MAG: hypothetical protein DMG59_06725 [Acidobacteriota bacterium]